MEADTASLPPPVWCVYRLKAEAEQRRQRDARQLAEVFDELLATEATYLRDLRMVEERFLAPMRSLLPPPMHHAIFGNLPRNTDGGSPVGHAPPKLLV